MAGRPGHTPTAIPLCSREIGGVYGPIEIKPNRCARLFKQRTVDFGRPGAQAATGLACGQSEGENVAGPPAHPTEESCRECGPKFGPCWTHGATLHGKLWQG